jgi:uncharacterized membrane protein YhdT
MNEQIVSRPLSLRGKGLMTAIVLEIAALWIVSLFTYFTLPEEIATHFGLSGKPTSYGDKTAFLILPIAFSLAPAIFLIVTRFRFMLINKYPYLINLPAFYTHLSKLPENRRGAWINKYFELVLALGVSITLFLLLLLLGISRGTFEGYLPAWFTAITVVLPIVFIVPFVYGLRVLSKQMQAEVDAR